MGKRVSDEQFARTKHQYTDPRTGERVVGVTSIVGCFDPGDKLGAGAGAAAKLIREGKDYRKVWGEAAERGRRVHSFGSQWAQGLSAEVGEEDAPYMDAFEKFCNDYEPTWLETERAVVSDLGYGGRFNLIGELRGPQFFNGAYHLIDIKTGKSYPLELALQLAAYKHADGMIRYNAEGHAASLDPMPHVDHCAGLYLHDDGTYDLLYVEADEDALAAFLSLLAVKQWAKAAK